MRTAFLFPLLLLACSRDPESHVDAGVHLVDAKAIDAPADAAPDAPPDAPNMDVVAACMHACDAIGVCAGSPTDPECYTGCQTDLADCTMEQVAAVDACRTAMCGNLENGMSPLLDCIKAVSCVDLAAMTPSR